MTSKSNQFKGFDVVFEEENQPQQKFQGFDLVFDDTTPDSQGKGAKVEGIGRQLIKGAKEVGSGLLGLPGDIMNLFDYAATGIEDAALKGALALGEKAGLSEETSQGIRERREKAKQFKADQFRLPGTEEVQETSDSLIQDLASTLGYDLDVKPQNTAERVSRRALEFASTAPVFGAGKIASLGSGAGSQIAEELGFGTAGQIVGALAGGGTAGLGRAVVKGGLTPIQSAKEATAKGLVRSSGLNPSQIKTDLIKSAISEGVDLPVVAKVDNALIKSLYTKSFQSGLTSDVLRDQVKNTTEAIVDNIKKVPEQLGGRVRESKQVLGDEIQEVAKNYMRRRKREIGELYDAATSGAQGLEVNGVGVYKYIQNTRSNLDKTLIKGTEKQQTLSRLDSALEKIATTTEAARVLGKNNIKDLKVLVGNAFEGPQTKASNKALKRIEKVLDSKNPKSAELSKAIDTSVKELDRTFASKSEVGIANKLSEIKKDLKITKKIPDKDIKIPVDVVIETMKDINDIVNFENFGGTNKLLLKLKSNLDETLQPFKKENIFGQALERANKEFAELAKVFQSDKKLAKLLHNPEAEGLVKLAKSPEALERLFKALPPGESALKSDIKRTLLEDAIITPLMNKDGVIDLGRVKNVLANKDSARLVKHIVGGEQFKKLQNSQKFAREAFLGLEEFINRSKSGITGLDVAGISSAVSGIISSIALMNPKPAILGLSPLAGAQLFTATIKDPKMIDLIIEMGKANKFKGTEKFANAMAKPLAEFTRRLGQIIVEAGLDPQELGIETENK